MSSRAGGNRPPTRLLFLGVLAALALIVLMGLLVDRAIRAIGLDDFDDDLEALARVAAEALPEDPDDYAQWASSMSQAGSVRVSLIRMDGLVLADSHQDADEMEDHSDRPEVVSSLEGDVGIATRVSATTGIEQRYVALPPQDEHIVRVSIATRTIEESLDRTTGAIIRVSLLVGLLAAFGVALLVRRLIQPIGRLADQAEAIAAGELEITTSRSSVGEVDRLGVALTQIARDVGGRVTDAEEASSTLQFVLGAIPQGTILFDGSDRIVYANSAAGQILGVVPNSLSGLTPFPLQTAVREARETGRIVVKTVDHGRPARRVRSTATPFRDDDRALLVLVDVTERERIDAIRRDFVANASHELKTPVATIIAASEAIQIAIGRGDDSADGFAAQIETSARRLDRLVADLLDLSRLERDTPELSPIRLDLVVQEEIDQIAERIVDNGLTVAPDLQPATVMASRRDIAIATHNLLDNAIRYSADGGRIDVMLRVIDGRAVLTVADDGEGIPTRDLERVFERFYRVDSARSRVTGGTGLGLSMVRHVAETHGGRAWAESELGAGSTFTFQVPIGNGEVSEGH